MNGERSMRRVKVKSRRRRSPSSLCPRALVGAAPEVARLLLAAINRRLEPSVTPAPLRRDPRAVHPRALPRAQAQHRPRPSTAHASAAIGDSVGSSTGTSSSDATAPSDTRHPSSDAPSAPPGGAQDRGRRTSPRSLRVHLRQPASPHALASSAPNPSRRARPRPSRRSLPAARSKGKVTPRPTSRARPRRARRRRRRS